MSLFDLVSPSKKVIIRQGISDSSENMPGEDARKGILRSLIDLVIPSKKIIINQAIDDKSEVALDVYGLTTSDFARLAEEHATVLAFMFSINNKSEKQATDNSKVIMLRFPDFGASCIALGCKEPEVAEHVKNLPLMTQVELLAAVLSLTFPDGLKKSLEKLSPTLDLLLK
ncbi:hypothetical protein [Pseudomonas syringae]|uniref:phage pre-tape measure protein n=1 Tax=Pseudomonas syringae TaxID=317 RepID=UPI001E4B80F2|nr:hypothetical protein [Pseudomonas syringae]